MDIEIDLHFKTNCVSETRMASLNWKIGRSCKACGVCDVTMLLLQMRHQRADTEMLDLAVAFGFLAFSSPPLSTQCCIDPPTS